MLVNQLSVFLENKSGKLSQFVHTLAENKIDLQALSIAETSDYGILRTIVDKPEETAMLLAKEDWPCIITPVLAVTVPDEPGSLTHILSVLAENGISLAYSYAFFSRNSGRACIILKVDDNDAAEKILSESGIEL